ncbi:hypothetical protein G3I59_08555 [Amycolatopsis rubida]|uniref:Uncharacterized protein n=1 Tax=Amycolatopsis rubida TaxID=112413 RepID=A0ABX0BS06_9PSEU|nr:MULTISPECIES: DUF6222 family protein [Amycolatopsis]MYW90665.1 hypothetical protein [Amycolatopsis rubida]NEC55646.1 hypothetical protein [Amycolatopsis rubida]OAP20941.1 hypothetical protein A4R44_08387 [Amycolatopsis sp. M39]
MTPSLPVGRRKTTAAKPRPEPADAPPEAGPRPFPQLSRGIVWADIVAEIERDAAAGVRRRSAA